MFDPDVMKRAERSRQLVNERLLASRHPGGHWEGHLSESALSTATAVMAFLQIQKHASAKQSAELAPLIAAGLEWLNTHQNEDGGWGDTVRSVSNISTTMLTRATLHAAGEVETEVRKQADRYIDQAGGVPAVLERYGEDHTFSVPILTHCALAGLVDWSEIPSLPYEMAVIPHRFYHSVGLPVVSYALPALIAIGQIRDHAYPQVWNPYRWLRKLAIAPTLRKLSKIQPESGGFLEATPLTSFVLMSLAGKGLVDHPVVQNGLEFLKTSMAADGSWPIDTNLATWVTTLAVNGLQDSLSDTNKPEIRNWLLKQQYQEVHPYTNTPPGGWAWTDLSGGVPDADDTPGALLALNRLVNQQDRDETFYRQIALGITWLVNLQNSNGGWPTFCKGWGKLPFDRSANDITAHVLRALICWSGPEFVAHIRDQKKIDVGRFHPELQSLLEVSRVGKAIQAGFRYLDRQQTEQGSWLPLWFGNQHAPEDENPVFGTARVLHAYTAAGFAAEQRARKAVDFLVQSQDASGGWGGIAGLTPTIEETSLALDALIHAQGSPTAIERGMNWLCEQVESTEEFEASPIGFYFAKLWYFEDLYPLVFSASALNSFCNQFENTSQNQNCHQVVHG